jgi:hypothetical protein
LIAKTGSKPGVGHAKHVMTSLNPEFSEKDMGFEHWYDFLEWSEAQGYVKLEGDLPETILVLPLKLPPQSVKISKEVNEAFSFLAKIAEDGLNEGKPYSLRDIGITIRELGLKTEKLGYRRFSDFVLSAEKRGMIRIVAPEKEGESPIVLPVYDVDRMQSWFEENVEELFGATVNVPKPAFLKKISQMLLDTKTSLTELENCLTVPKVKEAYNSILTSSNLPFLPPFQQSLTHILIGKGLDCEVITSKVNEELSPLGITLTCPE